MRFILITATLTVMSFSSQGFSQSCRDLFAPERNVLAKTQQAHLHTDLGKYIAGMEKSSLQKAAYAALARPGHIVDLGTGSGIAARDLAVLFPNSKITGIDLDPDMVRYAQDHYAQSNLRYAVGNAEKKNFPDNSLDTIFMSSTAHHLTSYGTGSFDVQHVRNAIAAAYDQLKPGGLFIFRDFVTPDGPKNVLLDLPTTDGAATGTPLELSTAGLFERFSRDFRSSQHPRGGVRFQETTSPGPGWRRFRLSFRDATEFLLRKDYRAHYDAEIKEEYTFMKQSEFESAFREAGFRILHSAPIYNPWIVANRYRDKVRLWDESGNSLPFPATNYVITGEKITRGQAMALREESVRTLKVPQYLQVKAMREKKTGQIFDTVSRAFETTDVLPYFESNGRLHVVSKQGFPRPILTTLSPSSYLDKVHSDGYVVEPLSFLGKIEDGRSIAKELRRRAGIKAIRSADADFLRFYTSPGMISERVTSIAVQVDAREGASETPDENYSGFSTSGTVRSIEANQVLRSAQAGSVLDSRLELGVYELLLSKKKKIDAWIGEAIRLTAEAVARPKTRPAAAVLRLRQRRAFEDVAPELFGQYLQVREGTFTEIDSQNRVVSSANREYVEPRTLGPSVISTLPVAKMAGEIYVGLERRQLPSVQSIEGSSDLVTNPAWRLNKSVQNLDEARAFARVRLDAEFGVRTKQIYTLGGAYHSSAGLIAETLYPVAVEVQPESVAGSKLTWVALRDLVDQRGQIRDGHLLIVALRLAHALDLVNTVESGN